MLQRIQTLYFLSALALLIVCLFIPLAELITVTGTVYYTLLGLSTKISSQPISAITIGLSAVTGLLLFINIFRYQNRKSQIRISLIVIILFIATGGLVLLQLMQFKSTPGITITYKIPLIFPFISAILTYLGYRGIKKDEELVRSYDRIR